MARCTITSCTITLFLIRRPCFGLPRSSVGIMLRVFRILRTIRLIRVSSALKQLGRLLIFALPSFFNIMLILCSCQQ